MAEFIFNPSEQEVFYHGHSWRLEAFCNRITKADPEVIVTYLSDEEGVPEAEEEKNSEGRGDNNFYPGDLENRWLEEREKEGALVFTTIEGLLDAVRTARKARERKSRKDESGS